KPRAIEADAGNSRRPEKQGAGEYRDLEPLRREHLLLAAPACIGDMEIVDDDLRRGAPADVELPADADLPADRRADRMLEKPRRGRPAAEPDGAGRCPDDDDQDRHQ